MLALGLFILILVVVLIEQKIDNSGPPIKENIVATKKQKRAAALAKREQFMANERARGLAAQKGDRDERRRKNLEDWRENHEKRHSWKKRIKECPHCRIELRESVNAAEQAS